MYITVTTVFIFIQRLYDFSYNGGPVSSQNPSPALYAAHLQSGVTYIFLFRRQNFQVLSTIKSTTTAVFVLDVKSRLESWRRSTTVQAWDFSRGNVHIIFSFLLVGGTVHLWQVSKLEDWQSCWVSSYGSNTLTREF